MSTVERAPDGAVEGELHRLHSSVVAPEQIDTLGHMNVRFYGTLAMAASRALADELELTRGAGESVQLAYTDMYTRHYREQLEGAPLEVRGGILEANETQLRVYHELVNAEREELSATFVHVIQLQDPGSRKPESFTPEAIEACRKALVAWPEHGRPRSIDLDRDATQLSLAEARARGIERRQPRVIQEAECGEDGFFEADNYLSLIWEGEDPDRADDDDWLRETADGRKFGYATMESRNTAIRLPRPGDRIQSFGAEVEIGRKVRHEKYWVFDLEREDLLCTASIVNVAFDIAARRSMEIPDKQRAQLEKRYHPDLR